MNPQPPREHPTVDAATVAHVARLARVHLQPDEAVGLEHDLREILGFVEQLHAVDTAAAEPLVHPPCQELQPPSPGLPPGERATPLREDVPDASLGQAQALQGAPETAEGCFVVPRVVG